MGFLDDVDLSLRLSAEQEAAELERLGRRLLQLRLTAGGLLGSRRLGPPLCVLMEGWDAAGKGGAIKRLVAPLDARHVRVATFGAPTPDEQRHHFLHRFVAALPGWGGMAVMDRTWYGRVLVERVEGYATTAEWTRAYGEIEQFERIHAEEGMIFLKIWLHISDAEQLKRFEKRGRDPLKSWKLTDEDWRNREKRAAYLAACEDMFEHTSSGWAPWRIVAAESKSYARVEVMRLAVDALEDGLRRADVPIPEPV
ncbi:MAG: UDP-galactose-lipid carrier transferase [Solirubrobacterales bacterium]